MEENLPKLKTNIPIGMIFESESGELIAVSTFGVMLSDDMILGIKKPGKTQKQFDIQNERAWRRENGDKNA
jgi:hypothetical protein